MTDEVIKQHLPIAVLFLARESPHGLRVIGATFKVPASARHNFLSLREERAANSVAFMRWHRRTPSALGGWRGCISHHVHEEAQYGPGALD